ncbi:hypothetical protein [Bradyrhizobium sp. 5.13L]|jgi:hypothetical protein
MAYLTFSSTDRFPTVAAFDTILDDRARCEKRLVMANLSKGTPLLALQDL